jgi:hypothetical protein
MSRKLPFFLSVAAIAALGIVIAVMRHLETGVPWTPGEKRSVWLIEARVDFLATGEPVTVSLSIPEDLEHFDVGDERSASPGYGFAIIDDLGDRRIEWTRREAQGQQSLYYIAQFSPRERPLEVSTEEVPQAEAAFWSEIQQPVVDELLERALQTSSSPRSLARELVKLMDGERGDQNAALLLGQAESVAGLLSRLLNSAGVPARRVLALQLEDARRRQPLQQMLEVYENDAWHLVNPQTGEVGLPDDTLLWHRQGRSLLDVEGGTQSGVSFSMIRQSVSAETLSRQIRSDSAFYRVGVQSLPIEEQSMFKVLLLLPLGALVVVFMRIIVGVQTAGTFMPVLIALAFLQTSLLPGLLSFVSVVFIGLIIRGYLSRLSLLLVSRIAVLIVLVIGIISALSIIGYQLGYSTGMVITFFPMIIIAWTIERMSVLWEEEGAHQVLVQGGGSLIVAMLAYLLMRIPIAGHLTFNFPELNLVLLAVILALGQYTGFKLSELRRFGAIKEELL